MNLGGIEDGARRSRADAAVEFAILYSNDWFVIPVDAPVGVAAASRSLVVTDAFGERTLVRPAPRRGGLGHVPPRPAGATTRCSLAARARRARSRATPVEEVLLLRDEIANIVWGVERLVQSAGGGAVDRHEQYLESVREAAARPAPPEAWPPNPPGDLTYALRAGLPPEHWLPLIPQADEPGRLQLRALARPGGDEPIEPLGELLGATQWLAEEEVPRDGVRVVRRWQLARGSDGATHLWRSRRKLSGRGEASSGFRHDVVERADRDAFEDAAPAIAGIAQAGRELQAVTRTWSGAPPFAFTFRWRRCDAAGEACADIPGATARAYVPTAADVGSTLRVTASANGPDGTLTATSPPTEPVAPPLTPPEATAPPAITGRARVGEQLTASPATWTGTPPLSFAYRWRRCDSTGAGCTDIPGATSKTYTPVPDDQGATLRAVQTATNAQGSAAATSAPSELVAPPPAPPQALHEPSIFGAPETGRVLEAAPGVWSGEEPIALTQRWQRSDADGASFADIAGATAATYAVALADAGRRLRVVVGASNVAGRTEAASAPTAAVPPPPEKPVNVVLPAIAGLAATGQWLTAQPGQWTGSAPRFAHQWLRCDAVGRSCRPIEGAREGIYRAVAADAGAALRVEVHASNDAGSAIAQSPPTAPVASPPSLKSPPQISGAAEVGATLSASPGIWSGSGPITYAYRWLRCDASGGACNDIAGASNPTYVVAAADLGASIRVVVTAVNAAGQASATAANTAVVVVPSPPANAAAPAISGEAAVGATLTADKGRWSGSPPTGWAYAWLRCDATGAGCSDISGAAAATYVPAPEDAGAAIRVRVTAFNAFGSASAVSAPTAPVQAPSQPPESKLAPAISGEAAVGQTLRADPGEWTGEPKDFAYAWQRCDLDGKNCVGIRDASEPAYVPRASDGVRPLPGATGDIGRTLRVVVTASNAAGSASARSAPTAAVKGEPPKDEPPES